MPFHDKVLIIGGGVIGLACAHYLAAAGRQVRLIERENIGAGASHGNCGLVFTSDLVPLCTPGAVRHEIGLKLRGKSSLHISPWPAPARIDWLLRFASKCTAGQMRRAVEARRQILSQSARLFDELFRTGALEAEYERKGLLMVYRTEAGWRGYAAVNEHLRPHGCEAEPVRGPQLQALEPALRPDIFGAWFHRRDCHLRPEKLLSAWRSRLQAEGVRIDENLPLRGLRTGGGRVTAALTDRGDIQADHYVLAAGAWSPEILRPLGIRLPILPGKGYSITMGRPARSPKTPCYFHEKRVVATPWQSGYRLGGIMEFTDAVPRLRPKRIRHLKTAAGDYLREPLGEPLLEEWCGMRPMTYDDLPVIGRASGLANLFLATGHGMLGITTAPGTGLLVAEMIAGSKPHIDPAPFSPQRF